MCSVDAVILASGLSSRMGKDKLLLPIGGTTVIGRMLDTFPYPLFERVIVIYQSGAVGKIAANYPVGLGYNPAPHTGKSASIRLGLSRSTASDGVMFLVADQPLLRPATIATLVEVFSADTHRIVLPVAAGKRRNPVLFPNSICHELDTLTGDNGGKSLLDRYLDRCLEVRFTSAEEFIDIDTPEEYKKLTRISHDFF